MSETLKRPENITDEMLEFLDDLRESGDTNMFGARPWVASAFDIPKAEAGEVLSYWMSTFGQDDR
tara:strand:+ start:1340 stop:1534 length:195 start_codon:yes stop_codon:yes gene_type:complete